MYSIGPAKHPRPPIAEQTKTSLISRRGEINVAIQEEFHSKIGCFFACLASCLYLCLNSGSFAPGTTICMAFSVAFLICGAEYYYICDGFHTLCYLDCFVVFGRARLSLSVPE